MRVEIKDDLLNILCLNGWVEPCTPETVTEAVNELVYNYIEGLEDNDSLTDNARAEWANICNRESRVIEDSDKVRVLFKQLRDTELPMRNGACYDLFIPEDIVVQAGQTVKIPLGFACKLPEGWHALINMRSSTWKTWGLCLTNQTGIIDSNYCGNDDEWILSVYRPHSFITPVEVQAGTRIAQFRLEKDCPDIEWEIVDSLPDKSRGGFGSTGK